MCVWEHQCLYKIKAIDTSFDRLSSTWLQAVIYCQRVGGRDPMASKVGKYIVGE